MTRTDAHRPSAIVPSDYTFVSFGYLGPMMWEAMAAEREILRLHMEKTGGTYSRHEHGGICMVCGNASAMYTHEVKRGDRVAFTGTVSRSDDDASFGFFKRPTLHSEAYEASAA